MCHLWSKSLYPYPYLHTSSINFSFHPHFSSPQKIQNQPKPKIASVKDNKPAFLRKLLAAYLPNFSLCQVRRYKWRIKLAGDQLCFCSTSPIWFDESSWVTARIAKHCNVAFNCAKQAWSRATTKEEAGAGVPVPSWQKPCCLGYIQKTTCYCRSVCDRTKAPACLLRLASALRKHLQAFSGSWECTGAWAFFFLAVMPRGIDTLKTVPASANNSVQQERTSRVTQELPSALYFMRFTSDELYPGPASWVSAAGVW